MNFEELRHAQISSLDTLAGDYEAMVRNWGFSTELTGDVITPLQGSGWSGQAAEAAAQSITNIRNEIDAAFEEASGIAKALRDAHTEIAGARSDLEAAIRSAADQKMTVDSGGSVHWPAATGPEKNDPEYATSIATRQRPLRMRSRRHCPARTRRTPRPRPPSRRTPAATGPCSTRSPWEGRRSRRRSRLST
ncbi:hypothetical protein [Kitasatospora sp. SUK 42]|uniref:hypothetical protein n=1 Tax=Kitasatospora sp. SUK 42 TaxID=1588882 RepID=UPI0018C911C3|nr:hypothetical protein [Kitasatospora sp. SUK 42]MBV2153476.1 hypothetical protein [Kitasatospora sp. SUK 42]